MSGKLPSRLIVADLVGGLSVAGLMVPEAIAYSTIAGLPTAFGLTAAIIGPLAYSLIGRSRLAVVSATSGAAALLAAASASSGTDGISRVDTAMALTLLVAIFFLVASALRISALTSFVSRAVLQGFGLGLAITITIRQLAPLLGLKRSGAAVWQVIWSVISRTQDIHLPSALLGTGALIFLGVSRRYKIPAAGLVLLFAAIVALHFGPAGHFGIATAGPAALGFIVPHVPRLPMRDWGRLAQLALPIAIVILAESWATIRSLATAMGQNADPRGEIAALGLANLASGLMRGLPVGAGFSIGNASAQAGTASRMGAVIAAMLVAVVTLGASHWIALVPQPILAAIVITALAQALSLQPILSLFRLGRDQWIAVLAALGVLLLGLVNGLFMAVSLSVFGLLRRLAYPGLSELGRRGAHDFVDCRAHPEAKPIPSLLVMRPNAPLFFGNVEPILAAVWKQARSRDARVIVLSLEETDDLDSTSFAAISDFNRAMTVEGRWLMLARVHDRARAVLERGGLLKLAATATFSVDDAVNAAALQEKASGAEIRSDPQSKE